MRIAFFLICAQIAYGHAITFSASGRLGDWMTSYLNASHLSAIAGIPLLLPKFPYENEVKMEGFGFKSEWRSGEKFVIYTVPSLFTFFEKVRDPATPPTLFVCTYETDECAEWETFAGHYLFRGGFLASHNVQCNCAVPVLTRQGVLNVAAHVRTLSGGDQAARVFFKFPLRFPHTEYHKKQISRIYAFSGEAPMYVHLFSDCSDPQALLTEFRERFAGTRIEFGVQEAGYTGRVASDYFAMQQFDAIVSTASGYSKTASKFGDFDMAIYPVNAIRSGKGKNLSPPEVDQVRVVAKKSEWFPFEIDVVLSAE